MQLDQLRKDDDAVSPVIGVILMVAITVILAAVIATFVLGLGEQVSNTAPQASFSFDYTENGSSGNLTITHSSGATIAANQLFVTGDPVSSSKAWSDYSGYTNSSEVSAGDSITQNVSSDDTLRIVWRSETGQDSATMNIWEGPKA